MPLDPTFSKIINLANYNICYLFWKIKKTAHHPSPLPVPDDDTFFTIKINFTRITSGGDNTCSDGSHENFRKKYIWTIHASRRNLIWKLYFQFKDGVFNRICGIPDIISRDLIADLFDYAKSLETDPRNAQERHIPILVSIDARSETQTRYDVSAKSAFSSRKSKLNIQMVEPWVFEEDDDEQMMMEECSICLGCCRSSSKKQGIRLPCKHMFHTSCMLRWIVKNQTCPLCRTPIPVDIN